jgi:hypothetical protein
VGTTTRATPLALLTLGVYAVVASALALSSFHRRDVVA